MPMGHLAKLGEVASFRCLRTNDPMHERITKPARVMLVEDTQWLLDIYLQRLSRLHDIRVANSRAIKSVDRALELFLNENPDVVITDLSLTSGNTEGFEILHAVRELSLGAVVVLTTSIYSPQNDDDVNREIRRQPFDAVFHKLDFDHLAVYLERKAHELNH
jgi:DNA-binding NtrC family response regulator